MNDNICCHRESRSKSECYQYLCYDCVFHKNLTFLIPAPIN